MNPLQALRAVNRAMANNQQLSRDVVVVAQQFFVQDISFLIALDPDFPQVTGSGRVVQPTQRYSETSYAKGSGACQRSGYDPTDMSYK